MIGPEIWASDSLELRIAGTLWDEVRGHALGDEERGLRPGAGVLYCGVAQSPLVTRLLAREFVRAVDGVDYVPSEVGHGALTAGFTLDAALRAEQTGFVPLFVHGHGGVETVAFSRVDLASHARGYPSLVKNADGPVGGLVVAEQAVDVDLCLPGGEWNRSQRAVVVGQNALRLGPLTPANPSRAADRHARLFGKEGLEILSSSKVTVVGAGGVGMLVIQWLVMLGVGQLVVVDPGRVKEENRARLPGATKSDARGGERRPRGPEWLLRTARLVGTPKVRLAARVARAAAMGTKVITVRASVSDPVALAHLKDSDLIVLAADSDSARYAVNLVAHQYLVPAVQAGSRVQLRDDGSIEDVFAVVRPVLPEGGCLRCAGLYSAMGVAYETHAGIEGRRHDYGTGEPAPSVAAVNAVAASHAAVFVQFYLTGLRRASTADNLFFHLMDDISAVGKSLREANCPTCGRAGVVGLGDLEVLRIPTSTPPQGAGRRRRRGP